MEGFDRRSALSQSLMMGGLGILANNRARPFNQGPVGLGELLGAGGFAGMQHFSGLKKDYEDKAAAAAKEAASMRAAQQVFKDPVTGQIGYLTKGGEWVGGVGQQNVESNTKPPASRTRNLPGGRQVLEEYDPKTMKWNPVGDPVSRWAPPQPSEMGELKAILMGLQAEKLAGDIDKQRAEVEAKRGEEEANKRRTSNALKEQVMSASNMIERIGQIKMHAGNPSAVGLAGRATSWLSDSPSSDLRTELETLKNDIALSAVQMMKTQSATGATGLGPISNYELDMLKNSLANLNPNAGREVFRRQMEVVEGHYNNMVRKAMSALEEIYGNSGGDAQAPAGATAMPAVGEIRDGYRFKGGNPNDPNSWEQAE